MASSITVVPVTPDGIADPLVDSSWARATGPESARRSAMAGLPARPIADLIPGFIERASPDPGLGEPGRSAGIVGRVDPGRPHRRDAAAVRGTQRVRDRGVSPRGEPVELGLGPRHRCELSAIPCDRRQASALGLEEREGRGSHRPLRVQPERPIRQLRLREPLVTRPSWRRSR